MKIIHRLCGLLAGACLLPAFAQAPRAIHAERLQAGETIQLDGKFDEGAWSRAKPFDDFWQISPQDKVRPPVRTEARVAFDGTAIYVAFRAFDPDMTKLREPFARRDAVTSAQDMLVVNIDPIGVKKFVHFFRVNARGVVADGLYNEDTSNEDFSPDFDFDVATGRFDGGWTAEYRIPFSSLRYTDPKNPTFTIMFFRSYPREQRHRISSGPLTRDTPCFLCENLPLLGLSDLPEARQLAVTPQVTARAGRIEENGRRTRDNEIVPSVDVKWRPRADLIFDGTINPDFSQVELDSPQLSGNTQFALFFPEKRPFFLEGADILQSPMRAIYTRSVTDPAWGVRGTQRSGRFDGTALVTQDDGGGLVLLPGPYGTDAVLQNFESIATFARGRWQAAPGVTAGALATDRTMRGGMYNRLVGPDVAWVADEFRVRAQALQSWTTAQPTATGTIARGPTTTGHAAFADVGYNGPRFDQYVQLEDVHADFRADNGFFGQTGYRKIYSESSVKFRDVGSFNEIAPYINAEYKTTRDGDLLYQQHKLGVRMNLPRNTTIWVEARPNNLIVVRPGGGTRKRDQVFLGIESNPFAWWPRLYAEVAYGDRLDVRNNRIGEGMYASFQAKLRPHVRAEIEYRIDDDTIDSREPVAAGPKRIISQRVQQLLAIWHFSARDSLRTILQTANVKRTPALWSSPVSSKKSEDTLSVVYGHRRGLSMSLYVGATYARAKDADAGFRRSQSEVFVKGTYTFDLL